MAPLNNTDASTRLPETRHQKSVLTGAMFGTEKLQPNEECDLGRIWPDWATIAQTPAIPVYPTRRSNAHGHIALVMARVPDLWLEIYKPVNKKPLLTVFHTDREHRCSCVIHTRSIMAARLLQLTHGVLDMLARPHTGVTPPSPETPATVCSLLQSLPTLSDYLTQRVWDDGSPRITSTVAISYADGRFLITVRDRALSRVCFHSGTTLTEALRLTDAGLESSETNWRKDTWNKQKK